MSPEWTLHAKCWVLEMELIDSRSHVLPVHGFKMHSASNCLSLRCFLIVGGKRRWASSSQFLLNFLY